MEKEESKKMIDYLMEKNRNLEEENKYLRECVETWKWCFNRMEEQNTKILLHYLDNEE